MHVGVILIFSSRLRVRFYLCSLMCASKYPLVSLIQHLPQWHGIMYTLCFVCWAFLTSTVFFNVPWSVRLVLKNGPDFETFSNASEILGDTLNLWDNDRALACCIWRRGLFLDGFNRVNEFLCVFIKYQIMSYILNFLVENFLILTHDFGSTDQARHLMWVAGFQVLITTCMNRIPVHFRG
jgi:hypothetical protein